MPPCYPVIVDARDDRGTEMPLRDEQGQELLTSAEAAQELGLTTSTIRTLMQKERLRVVRLDARTVLIPRAEVERYRHESLGRPGRKTGTAGSAPAE